MKRKGKGKLLTQKLLSLIVTANDSPNRHVKNLVWSECLLVSVEPKWDVR